MFQLQQYQMHKVEVLHNQITQLDLMPLYNINHKIEQLQLKTMKL